MSLLNDPSNNNQYEVSGAVANVPSSQNILLSNHTLPDDGDYVEMMNYSVVADTATEMAVMSNCVYVVRRRQGQNIEVTLLDLPTENNTKYTNGVKSTPSGFIVTSSVNTLTEPQQANISISHDLSSNANMYATGHICTNDYS